MLLETELRLSYRFYIYAGIFAAGMIITLFIYLRNRKSVKRMDRFIDHLMDNPAEVPVLAGTLDEPIQVIEMNKPKSMDEVMNLLQMGRINTVSDERYATSWVRKIDNTRLLFFVKYGRLNKVSESGFLPVMAERYEFEPMLLQFKSFENQEIVLKGASNATPLVKSLRGDFAVTLMRELQQ